MLPGSNSSSPGGRHFNSGLIPEYLWRIVNFRQMDVEFALSQCVDLLLQPSEVARTVKIRKQIKNQWARDDPAFTLILMGLIFISTLAYCFCFATFNLLHIIRLLVGGLIFEFIICGCALVTGIRWYINKNMRIQRIHTTEQSVEWLYAFDIHCNALFASFLLVSTVQYCILPIILQPGFLATALANTLWLTGIGYYAYINFLGYSGQTNKSINFDEFVQFTMMASNKKETSLILFVFVFFVFSPCCSALPFIDRPERLFYPMGIVCLVYFLLLLLNLNVSRFMLELYFGHTHEADEAILLDGATPPPL